jgi:hypothetical protein
MEGSCRSIRPLAEIQPAALQRSNQQRALTIEILDKNFVEKTMITIPATARNYLPQESGTSQNALILNPPFCGDKIFTEKR